MVLNDRELCSRVGKNIYLALSRICPDLYDDLFPNEKPVPSAVHDVYLHLENTTPEKLCHRLRSEGNHVLHLQSCDDECVYPLSKYHKWLAVLFLFIFMILVLVYIIYVYQYLTAQVPHSFHSHDISI